MAMPGRSASGAVMQQKSLVLTDGGHRLADGEESVAAIAQRLPALLDKLAHLALLVDDGGGRP